MLGINGLELVVLVILGVLIVGPERLPEYAAQLGQLVRSLRRMANGAREQLRDEIGPDLDDVDWRKLDPRQYDPRRIIREALTDELGDTLTGPSPARATPATPASTPTPAPTSTAPVTPLPPEPDLQPTPAPTTAPTPSSESAGKLSGTTSPPGGNEDVPDEIPATSPHDAGSRRVDTSPLQPPTPAAPSASTSARSSASVPAEKVLSLPSSAE